MILYTARCLDEYLSIFKEITTKEDVIWYRGHSSASYRLEPTLFRHKIVLPKYKTTKKIEDFRLAKGKVILPNDIGVIEIFKDYYSKINDCTNFNEIDYLYIMQHYGISTRLLDFSKDPHVALYFATANARINSSEKRSIDEEIKDFVDNNGWSEAGAAIYCTNPFKMNENMPHINKAEIVDLKEYKFSSLANVDFPFAIQTNNDNVRIKAQQGVFVYFGFWVKSLEEYWPLEKSLYKIFIPTSCRRKIYEQLKCKGITHYSIFPDMEGISKNINETMMEGFEQFRKDLFDE